MFQIDRHREIYNYISKNKKASVIELSNIFDVTTMTIRRDLDKMAKDHTIIRVHGGAIANENLKLDIPICAKEQKFIDEKVRVAKEASKLITGNQTIILDAGSTCLEIAKLITDREGLKVVTTDIRIAALLMDYKNIEVHCTGGIVQTSTGCFLGMHTIDFIRNINADICFVGASSISDDLTLSTFIENKAKIKRVIMDSSDYKVLVTDNSKFNKKSFAKITNLSDFDVIIANKELNPKYIQILNEKYINTILA